MDALTMISNTTYLKPTQDTKALLVGLLVVEWQSQGMDHTVIMCAKNTTCCYGKFSEQYAFNQQQTTWSTLPQP